MESTVGIIWSSDYLDDSCRKWTNDGIRAAMEFAAKEAKRQNITMIFGRWNELNERTLTRGTVYNNAWTTKQNIDLNAIIDKASAEAGGAPWIKKVERTIPVINTSRVMTFCEDKLELFRRLPNAIPATHEKRSKTAIIHWMNQNNHRKCILKPKNGLEGRNVEIHTINSLPNTIQDNMITQPFIQPKGLPWNPKPPTQDLRVILGNGTILGAYSRQSNNDAIINISRGANAVPVRTALIPSEVRNICQEIHALLDSIHPYLISVDFIHDGSRWWLLECNAKPGLKFSTPEMNALKKKMIIHLLEITNHFLHMPAT